MTTAARPGVAYVFPGQGAQAVGMGADLVARSSAAREVFATANAAVGDDLAALCFDGPAEALRPTRVQQPAVVAVALAAFAAFSEALGGEHTALGDGHAIPVSALAGHSVGLWAAVAVGGSLDVHTTMAMVATRGAAMQQAAARRPGRMSAVLGLDPESTAGVVDEIRARIPGSYLSVANVNTPGQVVVGGDLASLGELPAAAKAAGARRVVPLEVSGAFHTAAMLPARDTMRERLLAAPLADPRAPVIANMDGQPLRTAAELRVELAEHVAAPLQWWRGVGTLVALGVTHIVEFGHKGMLTSMLRRAGQDVSLLNVYDADSADAVAKELRNV